MPMLTEPIPTTSSTKCNFSRSIKVKGISSTSVSLVWQVNEACKEENFRYWEMIIDHQSYLSCDDKSKRASLKVTSVSENFSTREVKVLYH